MHIQLHPALYDWYNLTIASQPACGYHLSFSKIVHVYSIVLMKVFFSCFGFAWRSPLPSWHSMASLWATVQWSPISEKQVNKNSILAHWNKPVSDTWLTTNPQEAHILLLLHLFCSKMSANGLHSLNMMFPGNSEVGTNCIYVVLFSLCLITPLESEIAILKQSSTFRDWIGRDGEGVNNSGGPITVRERISHC